MPAAQTLLDQADATGESVRLGRGDHTVAVTGIFDGAIATLEVSVDDGDNFSPVGGGVFTEPKARPIKLPNTQDMLVRMAVENKGASTSITAKIR